MDGWKNSQLRPLDGATCSLFGEVGQRCKGMPWPVNCLNIVIIPYPLVSGKCEFSKNPSLPFFFPTSLPIKFKVCWGGFGTLKKKQQTKTKMFASSNVRQVCQRQILFGMFSRAHANFITAQRMDLKNVLGGGEGF